MADTIHEMAPHHLPAFLPAADGSDPLFTFTAVFLIGTILGVGILYFTLHALPERLAHGANSPQMQLVGVMALLALFTHNNIFWVLALLLAAVKLPDISGPLDRISKALEARKDRGS